MCTYTSNVGQLLFILLGKTKKKCKRTKLASLCWKVLIKWVILWIDLYHFTYIYIQWDVSTRRSPIENGYKYIIFRPIKWRPMHGFMYFFYSIWLNIYRQKLSFFHVSWWLRYRNFQKLFVLHMSIFFSVKSIHYMLNKIFNMLWVACIIVEMHIKLQK